MPVRATPRGETAWRHERCFVLRAARARETARLLDTDDNRLEVANGFGATHVINNTDGKSAAAVMTLKVLLKAD